MFLAKIGVTKFHVADYEVHLHSTWEDKGVESGFVDEGGWFDSIGGVHFVHHLIIVFDVDAQSLFWILYPSASATSLPQNRGSPCSSLFHHLSEDIVNKSNIQYIGKNNWNWFIWFIMGSGYMRYYLNQLNQFLLFSFSVFSYYFCNLILLGICLLNI